MKRLHCRQESEWIVWILPCSGTSNVVYQTSHLNRENLNAGERKHCMLDVRAHFVRKKKSDKPICGIKKMNHSCFLQEVIHTIVTFMAFWFQNGIVGHLNLANWACLKIRRGSGRIDDVSASLILLCKSFFGCNYKGSRASLHLPPPPRSF